MDKLNSICVVAILRDEQAFLDEWIVYHKLIGVDHFVLLDDDPQYPLKSFLQPHESYTTVIPWSKDVKEQPYRMNQLNAYHHALNLFREKYEWMAFIDGDEFIVIKDFNNIKLWLERFVGTNSISLNWHVFGHNGFFEDPSDLITSSLTRRMKSPSIRVKSISRSMAIESFSSPHYVRLKHGRWVDSNNYIYKEGNLESRTKSAHINHYQCRSFVNWMCRSTRGDVNFNKENAPREQAWRLSQERCLRQFVTTVAKDKNEYVDDYMLRYRLDILTEIQRLKKEAVS